MLTIIKNRKINLFIIGYTCAFVILAIVGYMVSDNGKVETAYHRIIQHEYFATDLAMYDLPRINVNLSTGNGQTTRVRLDISIEVAKQDVERLEGFKPRITDKVISYMRTKRIDGAAPSDTMRELHEDILNVVDSASHPIAVHDVIFRQFLVM